MSFQELFAAQPNALSACDIARVNLLAGSELTGLRAGDILPYLQQLDAWAARVKAETGRHLYRFKRNPAEFEHSEGFFRMVMLGVVLSEDFHVQYQSARRVTSASDTDRDGFFANPEKVFLQGLLGSQRDGTCSSLPVLHVAIGRRLGYPLKLVTTKGHLFIRWEDQCERFNVEVSGDGINRFSDDYYRHWPFAITPEEEQRDGYLKSLSPQETLAVFLSTRAMCLQEAGRIREAAEAFGAASRFDPTRPVYRAMQTRLQKTLGAKAPPLVGKDNQSSAL